MTTVRLGESARYGLRLYGYVLGITVLGGAGVAAGALLAWPEFQGWQGSGQLDVATAAAGGVLIFLGLSVLVIGWLSTAFKLLADGVARGWAGPDAAEPEVEPEPESSETAVPGPDPNVGGLEPVSGADSAADEEIDTEPAPASDPVETPAENPPEPSPEEIAFGSSGDDEPSDPEPVDEPEPSTGNSGPLPGQNASSDPLADPGDE